MAMKSIEYRLDDPGFTIYHRAALGGLAATVRAWNKHGVPEPLKYVPSSTSAPGVLTGEDGSRVEIFMDAARVTLAWEEKTSARAALALLLSASFERTEQGMIFLPGQGIVPDREDVLVAIHNSVSQTFLQHAKKRPGSGVREVALVDETNGALRIVSYKKVEKYSHQSGQGTGLLGEGWTVEDGELPDIASIPQSLMPGATGGAKSLDVRPEVAFLLHYLMVACPVMLLRSRKHSTKTRNCVVVPDVTDLRMFAMRLHRSGTSQIRGFSNTYLGRIVGGAEEAALRFLLDLRGLDAADLLGVSNFEVVAMGKVAWDGNQQNRSGIARVDPVHFKELGVFEAAARQLGAAVWKKTKTGDPFPAPESPVPELVAANLASGDHWCAHFRDLVAKKQDFIDLCYRREGLKAMRDAIQNPADQLVIRRFQKAWEMTMGALGERSRAQKFDFGHLVEVEREKIRNELLRCKTSGQLTGWLLQFMNKASREGTPRIFSEDAETFQEFIFNPHNAERLQNLLLFALVSYSSQIVKAADNPDPE